MHSVSQYLVALRNPDGLCRRLRGMRMLCDKEGRPLCSVGNSAAVFRILLDGQIKSLRCYTRTPSCDLELIYGDKLLRRELFIHTDACRGEWVDVVIDDWIEGDTLDVVLKRALANRDRTAIMNLSRRFDALAAQLLADDWAHGDLKPENIVVDPTGELHTIDFDARFLPSMRGRVSPELGTPAYRHPSRTAADFDAWLDHYPATLISTQLRALALEPELYDDFPIADGFLFLPEQILGSGCEAYCRVLDRLATAGDAIHYRLARALRQTTYRLVDVEELFRHTRPCSCTVGPMEFYMEHDLCGFRSHGATVIPPVYDEAFDFSEGCAAVRIGSYWHYIDPTGRPVLSLPPCEAVKPVRGGMARFKCLGTWIEHKIPPPAERRGKEK